MLLQGGFQRDFFQRPQTWLALSTGLFLSLFFLLPSERWHRNFYYLAVLLPYLGLVLRGQARLSLPRPALLAIGLLAFYLSLTLLWSSAFTLEHLANLLRKSLLVLTFVSLLIWLCQQGHQHTLILCLLIGAGLGAVLSIGQFYLLQGHPLSDRLEGIGRGGHAIKTPVMYATVLIALVATQLERRTLPLTVCVSLAGLYLLVPLLSQSRGVLAVTVLVIAILLLLRGYYRALVTLLLLCALLGLSLLYFSDQFERMLTLADPRYPLWQACLQQWWQHPWFGTGIYPEKSQLINNFYYAHPHNVLLSHLLYGGLVAAGLLLFLWGYLLYRAWLGWYRQRQLLGLALLLYGLGVMLFDFSNLFKNADVEWLFFWLPVACILATPVTTEAAK